MSGVKNSLFALGEKGMDMEGNNIAREDVEIDESTWYKNAGTN